MHAKAWLRHCSRSCHPRSAARQGWVCPSDIPCSRCPRSWSAADSPNLCTNLKLRVHQLDIFVVHTVSFVFIDVELTTPEGVHWRKSTRKWLFLGPALQGRGASSPAQGQVTHTKPYTDELQILSSLCMPRHGFATAVEVVTPDQLRDRVGCAHLIYPVQGVRAAGLQLTPLIYARILKLRVHQLDNICSSHSQFRFHRCRIDDTRGRSLAKKYPKMALFGTSSAGAWGF